MVAFFPIHATGELSEALQIIHVVITTHHRGYQEALENEAHRYKKTEAN